MADLGSMLRNLPNFLTIVNVVVLLCALFFFTSTLSSHILEAFVGFINSRGRQLRRRLETALGKAVADEIYNHPLIKSLATGDTTLPTAEKIVPPSYIEPALFASVVSALYNDAASQVSQSDFMQKLRAALSPAAAPLEPKIVEWFKALTDRQSGVYTRWSLFRLMIIGFAFAAAMDIDTVHIGGTMWAHPEVAESIVTTLEEAMPAVNSADAKTFTDEQKKKIEDAVASAVAQIKPPTPPFYAWQNVPSDWGAWLSKILGWLLTALATSLGAQFWFNILSEALKLRAAGRKPG